jgi:hypothetical protein
MDRMHYACQRRNGACRQCLVNAMLRFEGFNNGCSERSMLNLWEFSMPVA